MVAALSNLLHYMLYYPNLSSFQINNLFTFSESDKNSGDHRNIGIHNTVGYGSTMTKPIPLTKHRSQLWTFYPRPAQTLIHCVSLTILKQ